VHAVVLLLEQSADLNTPSDDGQSPLIVATANGHTAMAALLRKHGANEDHKWMGLRGAIVQSRRARVEGRGRRRHIRAI
jgi:ankyrin repeat protein